jgi:hypothetical protein
MPFLDVADVLLDPDFCETLTVTRAAQTAVVDHLPTFSAVTLSVTAVVQPARSNDLQRLLDAGRIEGGVTVYAFGAGALETEDTFVWQGDTYTIMGTDDWSKFGAGYVQAVAAKTNLP